MLSLPSTPTRRIATVAALVGALGAIAFPSLAQAAPYEGAIDHWGATQLEFSIDDGVISGLSANNTGRVDCTTTTDANPSPVATDIDPLDVTPQGEPVALTDGNFSVQTTGVDNYDHQLAIVAAGTVTPDLHRVDGTFTIDGSFDAFGKHYSCHDVQPFQSLQAPATLSSPAHPTFDGNPVSFMLKGGRITKLEALANVECPSTTVFDAQFNSAEYRYDPIHTDKKGNFELTAAAFTGYGTIMDFTISGQISGEKAKGKITATYEHEINGEVEVCNGTTKWKASSAKPPSQSDEPSVFFDLYAIRFGQPGDYSYWFRVALGGCSNANRVSVQVLGHGKAETLSCNGGVNTEPLTPQRTYKIQISALKTKVIRRNGKKIRKVVDKASVTESVYLPGPDGNWQQIRPLVGRA